MTLTKPAERAPWKIVALSDPVKEATGGISVLVTWANTEVSFYDLVGNKARRMAKREIINVLGRDVWDEFDRLSLGDTLLYVKKGFG